eukprot:scaffold5828_cov168-Amphora_coffeaeformis.AAC.3
MIHGVIFMTPLQRRTQSTVMSTRGIIPVVGFQRESIESDVSSVRVSRKDDLPTQDPAQCGALPSHKPTTIVFDTNANLTASFFFHAFVLFDTITARLV